MGLGKYDEKTGVYTDPDGTQWDRVSILTHGSNSLQGRMMKTPEGLRTIEYIRPYKYKGCTVRFTDGTDQTRDFDESFHVVPNTNEGRDE